MPILLVFLLTAACLDRIDWPSPPLGLGPRPAVALTAAAVLLPLVAAFAARTWAVRALGRDPSRRVEVAQGYARLRRLLFFVNLGAVAVAVLVLGWGWAVHRTLTVTHDGRPELAPFAELAVPLPYFLLALGGWLIHYDAEKALHRLTPGAAVPAGRPFWSRAGYVAHQLRQLALLVGIPIGLFVTQQSLSRMAPELTRADWYRAASVAAVPVLVLLMPLLIKPLLGLQPLPAGPIRERLEALARRLGFRYTDLLVWPTRGAAANAMIVGLVPRVRYVIFTDRILDELPPDELDAVFGHEVGHARHGHIWFYAGFLALSMTVLAAAFLLVGQALDDAGVSVPDQYAGWLAVPPVAAAGGYIFLVFGFLSRRCERQADVFGCRAVSCADPHCTGHDEATAFPPGGRGLCPTGIRTFARGLERVYLINGFDGPEPRHSRPTVRGAVRAVFGWVRAWQHSTPARRVGFLTSLIDDPGRERRFQRRVALLRWGLVAGLVTALVGLGFAVGWQELLGAL
jgi:Zn-dependent protease with chaperone function